jgi:hypothetical protein
MNKTGPLIQSAGVWEFNQINTILFVMVGNNGQEVTGLGTGFTLELSKNGAAFAASAGTKAEIGSGWYRYTTTAGEANTRGPVAVKVTGAGAVQQNLEYVVAGRTAGAVEFTYTVTDSVSGNTIEGANVWITSDLAGNNTLWAGTTNSSGIAVDQNGNKPFLDPGTVYVWIQRAGYVPPTVPDTEVIS